ncbi:MAG: ribosome recycling factor [Blastocatellia bacterium]|nr:ribosome recycling factor [Blastocatellia bacterium]
MSSSQIIKDAVARMDSTVEDARRKFAGIRTGRASTGMLDRIVVESYGTQLPVNQIANISVPEPSMLVIQPWDGSQIPAIEKAILASDIGITPSNDGKAIRLQIPPLTQERRKQLAKMVRDTAEEHRTGLRNVRRDANDHLKKMLKDKTISEDQERDALDQIQKQTDAHINKINDLAKHKEEEIMKV